MPDNAGHSKGFIAVLVECATRIAWVNQPLLRLAAAGGQRKELGFKFTTQTSDFFIH